MIKFFSFAMAFLCFVVALILAVDGMWWRAGFLVIMAGLYVGIGLDEQDRE